MNLPEVLESFQTDQPDAGREALMLELLPLLDAGVGKRQVWLLRSLNNVALLANQAWDSARFVTISPLAEIQTYPYYGIEFTLRQQDAPWPDATVCGVAETKERAAEMVAIAIERSGGWD